MSAPSGYRINEVLTAWHQARNRLLTDEEINADEALLAELLGPETEDVSTILRRLLLASIHCADMSAMADARIVEIEMRRDRYKKRAEAMRTAAYQVMEITGRKREELPELTATLRTGTPSVFIIDEALVPEQYIKEKIERSYDKVAIKAALLERRAAEAAAINPETGEIADVELPPDVPGATLSNGAGTIQIRRR